MDLKEIARITTEGFEAVGIGVLTLGALWAAIQYVRRLWSGEDADSTYRKLRKEFGRGILLGLEILVAADIIRTVAVDPSLENVVILGAIVLIRTLLSFSLEVETEGTWPWKKAA